MSQRVGKALRAKVRERARSCCEYCGMPDEVTLVAHEPDHIIATQHGGATTLDNLAYTCHQCNRYKGPNLASIDPQGGERAFLFNPRTDRWHDHFRWEGPRIAALTAVGSATAALLRFNDPRRVAARAILLREDHYPFEKA
ncbi:MAG: HNH endonuclease [Ktedonobacterales bacterium]